MKKLIYIFSCFAALLYACGDKAPQFKLSGVVENAAEEKLIVQQSVNGTWVTMDTVATDEAGEFSFEGAAPDYPQVFRLERKGRYIHFPVDSTEHITVAADTAAFDSGYTLSGSANAEWMMAVDKTALSLSGKSPADPAYKAAKRELAARILGDPSSIVAYYTVEKRVDGNRLFAPENAADLKIIGAVATGYSTFRPGNPLTKVLETEFLAARQLQPRALAPKDTLHAEEIGYIDIELKDASGKQRKLSDLTAARKVVLLNFTTYAAKESPDFNRLLAKAYRKYAPQGFEIYQIGYDNNEFDWKEAARNLPWTTVYDPAGTSSQNLLKYNVSTLPCVFIIGRDGTVTERVQDINDIERAVARNM